MTVVGEKVDLVNSGARDLIADLLRRMPPETTLRQFADDILLIEALREGVKDLREGRFIAHEEVMKEFSQWIGQ